MTNKNFFQKALQIDSSIRGKRQEIASLKETCGLSGIQMSDMPHSTTKGQSGIEKIILQIEQLEADIDGLYALKAAVVEAISSVPDERQRQVLSLRYISGIGWDDIPGILGWSRSVIFDLHKKGVKAAIIPEKYS